jgi:hypothetical protein
MKEAGAPVCEIKSLSRRVAKSVWFFLMVGLTMGDYLTRAGLDFR